MARIESGEFDREAEYHARLNARDVQREVSRELVQRGVYPAISGPDGLQYDDPAEAATAAEDLKINP